MKAEIRCKPYRDQQKWSDKCGSKSDEMEIHVFLEPHHIISLRDKWLYIQLVSRHNSVDASHAWDVSGDMWFNTEVRLTTDYYERRDRYTNHELAENPELLLRVVMELVL